MTAPGARRILTVCLGNHCRSPLAAVVLTQLGGPAVDVRSAGLCGKWVGQPAHPAMVAAAAQRGYDLTSHRSVQVSPELLAWADVILAMDHANLAALQGLADVRTAAKLALYLGDRDVPDPWGQDDEAFAICAGIIEAGARRHLQQS
ncbi:MAG: low molecular weight phosphotyrosine protein phosphatase [Streptomycetaceae bacterium]|nr:low molecular weight phosphotyrosine protein phosphatase [Streptomycetaceae bacterium]